ncbi:hypothetical protein K9M79_07350 [Candidatus Woesearchaeota archaeon]|nr:hypothetical protein [Candidatus Woesearchaeota archaeon]
MAIFYNPPEFINKGQAKSLLHTVKFSRFRMLVDKVYNLYESIRAFEPYQDNFADNTLSKFLDGSIKNINDTIKTCNKGLPLMPSEKELGERLFRSARAIKALEIFCTTLLQTLQSSIENRDAYIEKEFGGTRLIINLKY